ncbi:MAG: cupin domain-containing protein [Alphaproteobacteria bacterium]|nr:cupin domain-containing protein [Alphaproteobacteria bacterium]
MRHLALITALVAGLIAAPPAAAQPAPPVERQDALDPTPVDPARDPDARLFLGDWRAAKPRRLFGALVVHDILTPLGSADPLHPGRRGAVLKDITAISRATLARGAQASGRLPAGQRAIFYTSGGSGRLSVNGRAHELRDGVGFVLTPDFDVSISATAPLKFYVRAEPLPPGTAPASDVTIVSRWNNDRRLGAHWLHICNGGPPGMTLCTMAPNTMPQPHSHNFEEVWLAVKGESVLMLGKQLLPMRPGQAYKIPPSGLAAHSNINLNDEPIQMIYMGPAVRGPRQPLPDYAQLENRPIDPLAPPDADRFIGHWRDAFPRIAHGNLYVRDLLTTLAGDDPLRPQRSGAVLRQASAISHAMLEPGASAHRVAGEPADMVQHVVITAGSGQLSRGGQVQAVAAGSSFTLAPGEDFRLTAGGASYLVAYILTRSGGAAAAAAAARWQDAPPSRSDWHLDRRALAGWPAGSAHVTLAPMAMARPRSIAPGREELWVALDDVTLLIGKQLRRLRAGTAWAAPASGITATAAINVSGKPAALLHIVTAP